MTGTAAASLTIHVGITVTDLDRSADMFVQLFGYAVQSRGGRHARGVQALMGVDGADIEVVHLVHPTLIPIELIRFLAGAGRNAPLSHPNDIGFFHLSYQVSDIEEAIARAADHGVVQIGRTVGSNREPANVRRVSYLRAPDGIHFEFIQSTGQPSDVTNE